MKATVFACLVGSAVAQFGARNLKGAGMGMPAGSADVDLAMAGWEQLAQNPEKMQDVFASMKDPEVMAKAQEMLKDPTYMAAAKAKLEQLQAKAQARGFLDANGQPVAGAAEQVAAMMAGGGGGGDAETTAGAREYELQNAARHRAGELNDAELGIANLKQAMGDPSMMGSIMEMMKDPNTMAEVQKMMSNPAFQAQAQRVAADLKAGGGLDFTKMGEMMAGMAGGMGGMRGGAAAGAESEMDRLRRENAMLKSRMGMRDEL